MLKNIKCEKDLGVKVQCDLKVEEQVKVASDRASLSMRQMKNTFKYMTPEIFRTLYCSHVRPHMEFSIQAWSPYLKKDVEKLEKVQRRATKLVRGIRNRPYEERLKILDLHRLEKRRIRGDLIETHKILSGREGLDKDKFFNTDVDKRTRGEKKIFKQRSRLEIRKNFFSQRVVNHWNGLTEEVRVAETVTQLKRRLDKEWKRTGYGYQE